MTQDILNFLTGGVFTTFKDLILNAVEWVIRFIMNMVTIFISPLVNFINSNIPNIDNLNDKIQYVFDYATPYINYILDFLFLSSPILIYLIASIIFRISVKNSSYLAKLIVQWYEKLVP